VSNLVLFADRYKDLMLLVELFQEQESRLRGREKRLTA
jgi:hypothetical protein